MTEREYRQDDLRDVGYCPKCGEHSGEPLRGLTTDGRVYCDEHGWQWADYAPRMRPTRDVCDD